MNRTKLTLDDVLLKLQQGQGMTAVTELDAITGGTTPTMSDCHSTEPPIILPPLVPS